jgi:hypothetical protein
MTRCRCVTLIALIALAADCGDSTAPDGKPVQVTLQFDPPDTTFISDVPN